MVLLCVTTYRITTNVWVIKVGIRIHFGVDFLFFYFPSSLSSAHSRGNKNKSEIIRTTNLMLTIPMAIVVEYNLFYMPFFQNGIGCVHKSAFEFRAYVNLIDVLCLLTGYYDEDSSEKKSPYEMDGKRENFNFQTWKNIDIGLGAYELG